MANSATQNKIYEGWLYAAVSNSGGSLAGLFVTKDFGATWTLVQTPTVSFSPEFGNVFSPISPLTSAVPSNDTSKGDYDVTTSPVFTQGQYTLSLAVDPNNPNIAYLGGTSDGQESGLIRVDITGLYDSMPSCPMRAITTMAGCSRSTPRPPAGSW